MPMNRKSRARRSPILRPGPRRSSAIRHSLGILAFIMILALANLLWHDRSVFSEMENRVLATAPDLDAAALASGVFAREFDLWVSDRFVLRSQWLRFSRRIEGLRGGAGDTRLVRVRSGDLFENGGLAGSSPGTVAGFFDDEVLPGAEAGANSGSEFPGLPAGTRLLGRGTPGIRGREGFLLPGDGPMALYIPGPEPEIVEEDNNRSVENAILIIGNQGFEVVRYAQASAEYYTAAVSRFAGLAGSGVRSYLMVAPSHLQQIDPALYNGPLGADQKSAISHMYGTLKNGVIPVDIFPVLSNREAEGIYFRTDHHWTARGAYLAYREFAAASRFLPVPLSRYQRREVDGFLGSMYLLTGSEILAREPDTVELFEPFVEHRYEVLSYGNMVEKPILDDFYADRQNKYEIFISSDRPLAVIENEVDSTRRIAVVKDSYGNAFIPFLMPHYEEVHIIDPRYFDRNLVEYVQENGIGEVLFVNYFAVVSIARGYARNLNRIIDLPRSAPAESFDAQPAGG
jgi:hypothetical protein